MRKLALAIILSVVPLCAFSDVLFEQAPTDQDGFFSDGISTGGTQFYAQSTADNFSLASDSTVTSITFWGSSEAFLDTDTTNFLSWDIVVYDTSFNALMSANVAKASLSPTLTGNTNSAGGLEYEFTFNTAFDLTAGNYFLHVGSVNDVAENDAFVWSDTDTDGLVAFNEFDGLGWVTDTQQPIDTAFRIEGRVAAVPEPASMAVLGLGALALVRRRKNRS